MPELPLILLVDDDAVARFLMQRLLRPYATRVQVLEAANGQDALHLLDQRAAAPGPTLVLLDLNMPVMSGLAFLAHTQRTWPAARHATTKVVLVSSTELLAEQQQATELRAGFVAKPLTAAKLAYVLHQQFGEAFVN